MKHNQNHDPHFFLMKIAFVIISVIEATKYIVFLIQHN